MQLYKTNDGSFSLYNEDYKDYYHSLKDGAILETLYKHIFPSFSHHLKIESNKEDFTTSTITRKSLRILDICFGLGYNSFFSLAYAKRLGINISIYSPELDFNLLKRLYGFCFPKVLNNYLDIKNVLDSILECGKYEEDKLSLELFIGDARDYIQGFQDGYFDIIYQDAFSPSKNARLWSEEHFKSLYRILAQNGIITTYSSAANIRIRANNAGFMVEKHKFGTLKEGSIFLKPA